VGLIPATPAGHLLYEWLAAFNQASYPALGNALPTVALADAAAAQSRLVASLFAVPSNKDASALQNNSKILDSDIWYSMRWASAQLLFPV